MGKIENTIKDLLIDSFDPSILSIINESYMHNVPEGSESHFKVVIVSKYF
jgi:Stress-induced morphogen (activity unknown)